METLVIMMKGFKFLKQSLIWLGNLIILGSALLVIGVLDIACWAKLLLVVGAFCLWAFCNNLVFNKRVSRYFFYIYSLLCIVIVLFLFNVVGIKKRSGELRFIAQLTSAHLKHAYFWGTGHDDYIASRFNLLKKHIALSLKTVLNLRADGNLKEKIFDYHVNFISHKDLLLLFNEIFVFKSYFFHTTKKDPFIIDCGSHIGISVLFFKLLYPDAHIMAFEPNPMSFSLLSKNVIENKLRDVQLINKALWEKEEKRQFGFSETSVGCGFFSGSNKPIYVDCDVLSKHINQPVDFLKMDIEGAEVNVFEELDRAGKFALINAIGLEYHHHLGQEDDQLSKLLKILEKNDFGYNFISGGKIYSFAELGKSQTFILHAYKHQH